MKILPHIHSNDLCSLNLEIHQAYYVVRIRRLDLSLLEGEEYNCFLSVGVRCYQLWSSSAAREVLAHHRPPPRRYLPSSWWPHQGLPVVQRRAHHQRRPLWGLPVRLSLQPHPVSLQSHEPGDPKGRLHHMDRVRTCVCACVLISWFSCFLMFM